MTAAKPSRPRHARARTPPLAVSRGQFPALAAFLRGYLHEDLDREHGSAGAALAAFAKDAAPEEIAALDDERRRLGARLEGVPLRTARALIGREFGAAWRPATREELHEVFPAGAEAAAPSGEPTD